MNAASRSVTEWILWLKNMVLTLLFAVAVLSQSSSLLHTWMTPPKQYRGMLCFSSVHDHQTLPIIFAIVSPEPP